MNESVFTQIPLVFPVLVYGFIHYFNNELGHSVMCHITHVWGLAWAELLQQKEIHRREM
jgi:hypothetical protein